MARPSALDKVKPQIRQALLREGAGTIYTRKDLTSLFQDHRRVWDLPSRIGVNRFIEYAIKKKLVTAHKFQATKYARSTVRYTPGMVSPLALAATLGPRAYLSHGSALGLHGLLPLDETNIYINIEQSPKPAGLGRITQAGLDNAFRAKQRQSEMVYHVGDAAITQLSGKFTDRLGVMELQAATLPSLPVTSLERSLIDAVVRPTYAGGPNALLSAYKAARGRLNPEVLETTLTQLGHAYPFHQSIGFLLERAGHEEAVHQRFARSLSHKFYLTHAMKNPAFSEKWSLYHPANLPPA